jgi:hypothetical protein
MVQRWELAGNWNHDWDQLKVMLTSRFIAAASSACVGVRL